MTITEFIEYYYEHNPNLPIETWVSFVMKEFGEQCFNDGFKEGIKAECGDTHIDSYKEYLEFLELDKLKTNY